MTHLLQKVFELASALPEQRQDELGELLVNIVEQERSSLKLSSEQIEELKTRMAAPADYAADQDVERLFRRLTS